PPPPTQTPTDPTTTTTTAPAAKAKLYPSSGFAKALKSDKYYMEVLITSFDENNTRGEQFSAVRARDGKQQYLRVDTDFNIALLNTGKALTLLVPRESLGEQLRNEDAGFIEGLRNNIGRNLGLALSFSDIMKEATGESVLDMPEIDQIFSIVEMIFKDVGKFQYASTASSATKKYDVEVFKAGEDKLFFYFIQGEKEVSLVKREFKDGTSIMVNINVLNTKPDAKFFKVPAGYLNLSGETLKNFSALLG
ncbi:MAG: hypothetical protein FWG82_04015, partial [Oscillospiraceae bacterium]|nr:hypothetical protein [Oscillospiraceae bacterium]